MSEEAVETLVLQHGKGGSPRKPMMLFATTERPDSIQAVLRQASRSTGTEFEYLLATAERESGLDPSASAGSSSARGLFQFIESTWLAVLKQAGPRHGYADLASRIRLGADGYSVADAGMREEILALREDPRAAALMAGELTRENAQALSVALGREPSDGELYLAHFLGARGAGELVRMAETEPTLPAHVHFPAAARANPAIFYAEGARPRTAVEVYERLTAQHPGQSDQATKADMLATRPTEPKRDANAFHGLFSNPAGTSGLGPIGRSAGAFWSGLYGTPGRPGG